MSAVKESNVDQFNDLLNLGIDQLERGDGLIVASKEALDQLFDEIKTSPSNIRTT